MFKDIHCHLLPGIDDGSRTIEESIKILKEAEKSGVKEIIFTPHYIENTKYNCNNENKKELFNNLKNKLIEENINIKLYLGNEVYITENIIDLLKRHEITTLNNTRYLLFELPLNQNFYNAKQIIYNLITLGCIPILAHPERYLDFQNNPSLAEEYTKMGVLLQGNYKSLLNKYGKDACSTLKILLKNDLISFMGSDTHHDKDYMLDKAYKKVKKIVKDEEKVNNLFYNNFDKVINDIEI